MSLLIAAYGIVAYALFLASFLWAVAFVGNLPVPVPKTIDSVALGDPSSPLLSIGINLVLLTIFAVQHSVMARPAFKRWWTRFVPKAAERSTYVLFATGALVLLMACWQSLPHVVWSADGGVAAAIHGIFWLGWGVLLVSTFLLSHFELFGLKQSVGGVGHDDATPVLRTPWFYRFVRHPIYLGFLLAFWAAPVMTVGHLMFSIGTTGYILLGIALEERDLVATFGNAYRDYRVRTGMLLPKILTRSSAAPSRETF
jgi:protein-S-isoprenylcysteine O-methyltransferase Ste14